MFWSYVLSSGFDNQLMYQSRIIYIRLMSFDEIYNSKGIYRYLTLEPTNVLKIKLTSNRSLDAGLIG